MFFRFSLDYFVPLLFAFVVSYLLSSVLCQEIGWEERLRSDLFCVEWDLNTPFTRYNRLYRVNKHPTGCQTGLTTGWMFVYTIQPVVKHRLSNTGLYNRFDNRVERTATVRSTGFQTGLYNRIDNRLNVCIHDTTCGQTGLTTGLTTGCIV